MKEAEPFIERTFTVNGRSVVCRFFRPEADGNDFACRYVLDWPEKPRSRRVFGVDSLQALLLAMQSAHTDLLMAREDLGWDVRWFDSKSLGMPLPHVLRDLDPEGRL